MNLSIVIVNASANLHWPGYSIVTLVLSILHAHRVIQGFIYHQVRDFVSHARIFIQNAKLAVIKTHAQAVVLGMAQILLL